jgi:hypothetical protein
LIVHWDGFVVSPEKWRDDFLAYDYLGAPWAWATDEHRVGNGGFCIRSRKLLKACKDVKIRRHPEIAFGGIEDIVICRLYRNYLEEKGLRFGPIELAEMFSYETGPLNQQPFGFHGPTNMPVFVPEKYLLELVPALKAKIKPGKTLDTFKQHCASRGYNELRAVLD